MNSRWNFCLAAGLVVAFLPGCCVFEALFGCGHAYGPGCDGAAVCDDGHGYGLTKKCAKKCRKCQECLAEHGMGGGFYPGMGDGCCGDGGCGDGGCGGGMMGGYPGGGCAGCGQPGGFDGGAIMTTPAMTVPMPGPTPMMPRGGTALPPPIPPAETSSTVPQVPAGTQYVSAAEFQRLPGVIVSGPGSQAVAQTTSTVPSVVAAPTEAKPLDATVISATPTNTNPIQQASWAPARR